MSDPGPTRTPQFAVRPGRYAAAATSGARTDVGGWTNGGGSPVPGLVTVEAATDPGRIMRAVVADEYGGPEVLDVRDVDEPKVGPDSVLVRVAAASINPVDYKIVQGGLDAAFPTVFPLVPGWDVAGEVLAVGPAVRHVEVGQQVFGYAREDFIGAGTWAERTAVNARAVAPMPTSMDPIEASCLPLAGLTAYQSLADVLGVSQGDTVLVHAATGGVGTMATQIAVARGARLIGTCSEANHDHLRSLGGEPVSYGDGLADRVRELTPDGVDAVLDLVGGDALRDSADLLRHPRRIVSVIDPATVGELGGTYVFVHPDVHQLLHLRRLVDDGELRAVVQSVHDLDDVRTAVEEAATGHVRGKVVLRMP
jgi:NADPH:quinone reductase-like Zn-dependent oxidoreductase